MLYDVVIIGSGPAGYTAAIYAVRAGLSSLLLEGVSYGGQLMNTTEVENFPGFPRGINGFDLMTSMRQQCIHLGCTLLEQNVIEVKFAVEHPEGSIHEVSTSNNVYLTRTVIIATGATANTLKIPNGDLFWNNGISACAVCDGALPIFRDQPLVVVGGGDTACEEALFLSRFGSVVYMLVRSDKMRASHRMKQRVMENPKIQILYQTNVVEALGVNNDEETYLTGIVINQDGEIKSLEVAGLFYAIGHTPNTSFLPDTLQKDDVGYLITDNTKTNIPGVFACGDVQDKVYRQAITAAGTGCMAALEAERYLSH
jgi:thioredoxin reductase (NADPH)